MSAFFESLLARSFAVATTIRPRPTARFEIGGEELWSDEVSARPTRSERRDELSWGVHEPAGAVISQREEELAPGVDFRRKEEAAAAADMQVPERPIFHGQEVRTVVEREIHTERVIHQPAEPVHVHKQRESQRHETELTTAVPRRSPHIVPTQRASIERQAPSERFVPVRAPREQNPEVHVEVTIGRIELGTPSRPMPAVRPRPASPRPAVTLDDYLRRRNERGQ